MGKKQRGGKLLGQGVYGCAFDPPLICKKEIPSNQKGPRVGKLIPKEDAAHEYEVSLQLKTMPNAESYFVLIDTLCEIKPRKQQIEPDLKDCLPIKQESFTNLSQVIMPFGGKPLANVPHRASSLDFFRFMQHVLEAGTLLLTKRIVHGDLHSKNILMDSSGRGRFIDFGLAWSPENLTLSNVSMLDRVFNPAISQEPPEVSVLNGLLDKLDLNAILARIQDQKTGILLVSKLYSQEMKDLMGYLRRFIGTSWSFQNNNSYSYYKVYWSKIDAWGLGTLLLSLFVEMSMDPLFEKQEGFVDSADRTLRVCRGLLMMDPGLRWDAAEALREYAPQSPVLQNSDVKGWLETQDILRPQLEKIVLPS